MARVHSFTTVRKWNFSKKRLVYQFSLPRASTTVYKLSTDLGEIGSCVLKTLLVRVFFSGSATPQHRSTAAPQPQYVVASKA